MFTVHYLAREGDSQTVCGQPGGIGMVATSNLEQWRSSKKKCAQCVKIIRDRAKSGAIAVLYANMEESRIDHIGKANKKVKAARKSNG